MNVKTRQKKTVIKIKDTIFSFFQKLGASLLLPITLLPIAGILYGIGSVIDHSQTSDILVSMGSVIFENLPTFIFVSIAFKFSDDSGQSTLFGLILWLMFLLTQSLFIKDNSIFNWKDLDNYFFTNQLGFRSLNMSLFGGIFLGLFSAFLWKTLSDIRMFNVLIKRMFLSGVFLIAGMLSALTFLVIWPAIYIGINGVGTHMAAMPFGIDAFLYGSVNRLLLPIGMHTMLMPIMLLSPVGGTLMIEGGETLAQGDSLVWLKLSELNIPLQLARGGGSFSFDGINYWMTPGMNPGTYQQGFFPIMIFAFPVAGFVMSRKFEDKKTRMFIIISSITPMLTGITEPFEFLFVFISPLLYVFHVLMTGISFLLLDILNVSVWLSAGWFIDVILFGIIPQLNGSITNWWWIIVIGPALAIPYALAFWKEQGRLLENEKKLFSLTK